jgi:hypothetical protein
MGPQEFAPVLLMSPDAQMEIPCLPGDRCDSVPVILVVVVVVVAVAGLLLLLLSPRPDGGDDFCCWCNVSTPRTDVLEALKITAVAFALAMVGRLVVVLDRMFRSRAE